MDMVRREAQIEVREVRRDIRDPPGGGGASREDPTSKALERAGGDRGARSVEGQAREPGLTASLPLADAVPSLPEKGTRQLMRGPRMA